MDRIGGPAADERLEELVRRTLAVRQPPGLPSMDPWPAVRAGVGRRRRRRRLMVAGGTLTAIAAGVVVFGVVRPAAPARLVTPAAPPARVVPWLDQPASPYPVVQLTPSPPPLLRSCQSADLQVVGVTTSAAAGTLITGVSLRNRSGSGCTVSGYPRLAGLGPTGVWRSIAAVQSGVGNSMTAQVPATLAPGQSTRAVIWTSDGCSAINRPNFVPTPTVLQTYRQLAIGLPGGGWLSTTASINTVCGVWVFLFSTPSAEPVPSPGPYAGLTATLTLPSTVRSGTTVDYVVTLSNPTDRTIRFDPCPVYTEGGYANGQFHQTYRLNCAAAPAVPAHGAVRFAMRLHLPAIPTPTAAKFLWTLEWPGWSTGIGAGAVPIVLP